MSGETKVLMDGIAFGEGPRWHAGRLYFSDMHSQQVLAVDLDGKSEVIARIENDPSGLGWLPDGRMLVVSMKDRSLLRIEADGGQTIVADLHAHADHHCNDMVVDAQGRAYVGNFGWDLHGGGKPRPANLVLVEPDGAMRVVADGLDFPNGAVITPDGATLILAESFGARLTAFDIAQDGSLSNRRVFAQLSGAVPDGICLDAEGAVWVASPVSREVLRVREGGEVVERIALELQAFACMLGGPERRHLFICTAGSSMPDECIARRDGRIEVAHVEVAGAGLP